MTWSYVYQLDEAQKHSEKERGQFQEEVSRGILSMQG